jgi:hypothetical protein
METGSRYMLDGLRGRSSDGEGAQMRKEFRWGRSSDEEGVQMGKELR